MPKIITLQHLIDNKEITEGRSFKKGNLLEIGVIIFN